MTDAQLAAGTVEANTMTQPIWGIVRNGKVWLPSTLPEGTHVRVTPIESEIEVPPELLEEFAAWDRASAAALERFDRSAEERERHEAE